MTMIERIQEVSSTLPPQAQAELLDFAEFLLQKSRAVKKDSGMPLLSLAGGLEHSGAFSGSAMAIQEEMRRDWD